MSIEISEDCGNHFEKFPHETSREKPLEVVDVIGGHGPWQFRQWIVFMAASLCNSTMLFSVLFLPVHDFCHVRDATGLKTTNQSLSLVNSRGMLPALKKIAGNNGSELHKTCNMSSCAQDLVEIGLISHESQCWNSSNEIFARSMYVIAFLLSQLLVYFSTKKFVRRKVSLFSCLFLVGPLIAVTLTDNGPFFIVMYFVIFIAVLNIYTISALSLIEYVQKDYKILYFLTGHLGWSCAHFVLPAVAWLTDDWMSFYLTLTFLCSALFILIWWSPESPSFSTTAQATRSKNALKYAAFTNGYSISDVDMLSHNYHLQQEKHNDIRTRMPPKEKWLLVSYCLLLGFISFTTTFLYLSMKWHPNWLRVKSGRVSFSFLGTTEIAASIILLLLSCFISLKHLWACVSILASTFVLLIYFLKKDVSSRSSAVLYTVTMFFSSAAWALMLAKIFCHKATAKFVKINLAILVLAVFAGALASSASVLNESHRELLLALGIPTFIASVMVPFIPDEFFGSII